MLAGGKQLFTPTQQKERADWWPRRPGRSACLKMAASKAGGGRLVRGLDPAGEAQQGQQGQQGQQAQR